ncbi:hypothetical protein CHM34_06930 [Paludifilum halophilum]|uniref:N-acetylmuramoyl-L-alanine amidase n=2 Tax=Paludifilum halophilum TaxID=1642702 RepID=A0A235B8M5_9BACL|nr:hypothetical protein CHM34_06930 [Paludifilum halophilum]
MNPQYITIHNTANSSAGADAEAHARLLAGGNNRTASWHYTVDDHEAWHHIPDNENAWHAGDGGSGTGNRKSLSIEICENSDGNYAKAEDNGAWLAAYLMKKHGIPLSHVVPHQKWSGKHCPRKILDHWSRFIAKVEAHYKGEAQPAEWDGKSFPGRAAFIIGQSHPAVTLLGKRLIAHGYGDYYEVGAGPTFSEVDRKACAAFQRAQGWSGAGADGYPGPVTWERLMASAPGENEPEPKTEYHRVKVDGEQVASFAKDDNVIDKVVEVVRESLESDNKEIKIEIERVLL